MDSPTRFNTAEQKWFALNLHLRSLQSNQALSRHSAMQAADFAFLFHNHVD